MKNFAFFLTIFFAVPSAFSQAMRPPTVKPPVFKKDTLNIVNYGAVADGLTLNTRIINTAIADCSKKGGGVVLIPAGLWLTGPIELKTNVNLHLRKNAVLQASSDFNDYLLVKGNWEGLPQMRNQSPIWADGQQNIAITGAGIIDGAGDAWRMVKKEKLTESQWKKLLASGGLLSDDKKTWYPTEKSLKGSRLKNPGEITAEKNEDFYKDVKDFLRPNLLVLSNCKGILLEGVTFQNSPAWCLHPLMSSDIIVRGVQVKNPWYAQNGDGIDLESCRNVIIENSVFDVGDDGICIKSGRDEAGRKRAMPTQDVHIKNCVVYHAHGGFVIGSEMSGGAKNILVEDCSFIGTDIGLRFKTTRGRGGIVENIFISGITMIDIPGEAILFDMYYAAQDPIALAGETREPPRVEAQPVSVSTPQFQNFVIRNVVCNGAEKAIFIRGLPEMNVKNIVLENMTFQSRHGLDVTEASEITFKNIQLIANKTNPVLNIHNSKNITLEKIGYKAGSDLLLSVTGEKSTRIRLRDTDTSKAKKNIETSYGANPTVIELF